MTLSHLFVSAENEGDKKGENSSVVCGRKTIFDGIIGAKYETEMTSVSASGAASI